MNFRKFGYLVGVSVFMLCSVVTQAAQSQLRIFLGKNAVNVGLSIYSVAEHTSDGLKLLPEYSGLEIDFGKLSKAQESKNAAEAVYEWIQDKNIEEDQTSVTNEEGKAAFNVDSGLYLLAKESGDGEMSPVLLNVLEEFEGEYIDISPKYNTLGPDGPGGPGGPEEPEDPEDRWLVRNLR